MTPVSATGLGMRKAFRYKVKMNAACEQRADNQLRLLRNLYNAALEQRIDAWRKQRVSLSFYDQCRELTELRAAFPEYAALERDLTERTLYALHEAFGSFFRRIREGKKPGFPLFRPWRRFNSTV